jgi:hypothetical protein
MPAGRLPADTAFAKWLAAQVTREDETGAIARMIAAEGERIEWGNPIVRLTYRAALAEFDRSVTRGSSTPAIVRTTDAR